MNFAVPLCVPGEPSVADGCCSWNGGVSQADPDCVAWTANESGLVSPPVRLANDAGFAWSVCVEGELHLSSIAVLGDQYQSSSTGLYCNKSAIPPTPGCVAPDGLWVATSQGVWTSKVGLLPESLGPAGRPVSCSGGILVARTGSALIAWNADGERAWSIPRPQVAPGAVPMLLAPDDGYTLVEAQVGASVVLGVNLLSGDKVWQLEHSSLAQGISSIGFWADGLLVLTADARLQAFLRTSPDGAPEFAWSSRCNEVVDALPLSLSSANGYSMFLASNGQAVLARHADNGTAALISGLPALAGAAMLDSNLIVWWAREKGGAGTRFLPPDRVSGQSVVAMLPWEGLSGVSAGTEAGIAALSSGKAVYGIVLPAAASDDAWPGPYGPDGNAVMNDGY